uniref:Uncharacterized protein n=1 Tax=viral metagenome TaxID=1070528 RepID=A0A6C0CVZ1_9ZZZZ
MDNIPQAQLNEIVDDVFGDFDVPPPPPPIQENENIPEQDAEYERIYVKPFPQDKRVHVIGVAQLEPNVVYYKVMDDDTKFDKTQLQYLQNPDNHGVIYEFKDNFGHNDIPLTNQSRFIPAYLMLDKSTPNPLEYKNRFFSIYNIDDEETSNDEDSSDSDSDSDMSLGGKKLSQKKQKKFHYTSTQKHQHGGKKTVRHVTIKNGKGHKKVSHYRGNKLIRTIKKSLKKPEMEMIRLGKFIPGLFRDCQVSRKKSTTRRRRKKN